MSKIIQSLTWGALSQDDMLTNDWNRVMAVHLLNACCCVNLFCGIVLLAIDSIMSSLFITSIVGVFCACMLCVIVANALRITVCAYIMCTLFVECYIALFICIPNIILLDAVTATILSILVLSSMVTSMMLGDAIPIVLFCVHCCLAIGIGIGMATGTLIELLGSILLMHTAFIVIVCVYLRRLLRYTAYICLVLQGFDRERKEAIARASSAETTIEAEHEALKQLTGSILAQQSRKLVAGHPSLNQLVSVLNSRRFTAENEQSGVELY